LSKMDKSAKVGRNGVMPGGPLKELPSDYFRNHVSIVPYPEDDIAGLVDILGIDRVLFGSDYPHPEGFSWPLDFAKELKGLTPEQIRKIMHDNAATRLGLPVG